MSIASQVARIKADKEELRLALVEKGATLTGGALLSDFTVAVSNISVGNADVTYGVIDESGKFQALSLDNAPPTDSGESTDIELSAFVTNRNLPVSIYVTVDATVDKNKLLEGVVAYGATGKVTGKIPTVVAEYNGSKIIVPSGYIAEAQEFEGAAFGVINSNGKWQQLDLSTDTPAEVGDPITIELSEYNTGV